MKAEGKQVQTYYLEMLSKERFLSSPLPDEMSIVEIVHEQPEFNQFLYAFIGKQWHWTDKLTWTLRQWQQYLATCKIRTWVAYVDGAIAGYYELSLQNAGNVELTYFGLAPSFIGKGYGSPLLSQAIESAWSIHSAKRVWVHTCSLDHPHALNNYQKRGFNLYRTEVE
ncbi:GNAT family N-acetyltransferase [Pseudoalteromonas sp. SMS1]|nr:GNAT family N-acetyltransferase [Pseudoalteromonas sp. SMS1]